MLFLITHYHPSLAPPPPFLPLGMEKEREWLAFPDTFMVQTVPASADDYNKKIDAK